MAKLAYPNITVAFHSTGIAAIGRSQRGIVAMILDEKDTAALTEKYYIVYTPADIPEELSPENKEQISLALIGYQRTPKHIIVLIRNTTKETADYNNELNLLESLRWDYLVIPDIKPEGTENIVTWIKAERDTKDKKVKAVLPNTAADHEGIVNYVNKSVTTVDGKTYDTAHFCSRVAGLICGTPMQISCTFAPLPEISETDNYTKDELDAMIGNGQFVICYDGEKHKVARGINSLVTTMQGKLNDFKKIKLIDCMDMIHDDIKETAKDEYIGKYANSYDNRCLLVTAINGYFMELENSGLLEKGRNNCYIDLDAVKAYLVANGKKTKAEIAGEKEIEIKHENTGDEVFLAASVSMLDAIENISLNIALD